MSDTPKDDESKFNETLKRMLDKKPTPHKPTRPDAQQDEVANERSDLERPPAKRPK